MIKHALQMLQDQADDSVEDLTKIRTEIVNAFSKNYVVSSSTLTTLIHRQISVRYWTMISNIIARSTNEESTVEALREWADHTAEDLLQCGRSGSTSLVTNEELHAEDDEKKQVLRQVRSFLSFVEKRS